VCGKCVVEMDLVLFLYNNNNNNNNYSKTAETNKKELKENKTKI